MGGLIGDTIHDSTRSMSSSTVTLLINVACCAYLPCGVYKGTMPPSGLISHMSLPVRYLMSQNYKFCDHPLTSTDNASLEN